MHDAGELARELLAHRHDVTAGAHGDDRLRQHLGGAGIADDLRAAVADLVVQFALLPTDAIELRRSVVGDASVRFDGRFDAPREVGSVEPLREQRLERAARLRAGVWRDGLGRSTRRSNEFDRSSSCGRGGAGDVAQRALGGRDRPQIRARQRCSLFGADEQLADIHDAPEGDIAAGVEERAGVFGERLLGIGGR